MLRATKTGQLRNHSRFPNRLINIKQGRDGSIWALSRLSEIYLTLTWNGRSPRNEIQSVLDNRWKVTYIRLKLPTKESINSKQSKDAPMKLNSSWRGSFQAFLHIEKVDWKCWLAGILFGKDVIAPTLTTANTVFFCNQQEIQQKVLPAASKAIRGWAHAITTNANELT